MWSWAILGRMLRKLMLRRRSLVGVWVTADDDGDDDGDDDDDDGDDDDDDDGDDDDALDI